MTETLLNKISKYSNDTIVTNAWLTGQNGEIVYHKGDCISRFIDLIDNSEHRFKHTTEDSKLALWTAGALPLRPGLQGRCGDRVAGKQI